MEQATRAEWLKGLKVGDVVFFVGPRGTRLDLTIEKLGTKLVHTSRDRKFFRDSGREQLSAGTTGTIYPSQEGYEAGVALNNSWRDLQDKMRHAHLPAHFTQADIDAIRNLLFPQG
ncbi:hypothetical protein YA0089_27995 [Pseudomonas viridiflava]|uniref:beta barrel domain-containing protein n=1 Tax=Pseudomonas viridiflava TaxID=33069 RepID=UPI0018E652D6|nr:hypothetical protein [Pseudomonas viridiflava]MBI6727464.1 hypothetical protein [Pseudomonas viridiflava]